MKTKSELYELYHLDSTGLEKYLASEGLKYLGWQITTESNNDFKKCVESGHKVNNISHSQRGSDHTNWCEECKIYWKIDSSD